MSLSKDIDVEVGQRLPLADSVLRLLDFALDDAFLDGVFERHRGRCFERDLRFRTFVHLMADALLGHGSAHRSFLHAQQTDRLQTSVQAVYDRLATVPCAVSVSLLAEATARLNGVSVCKRDTLPASLAAFWTLALDGKKIKYLAKKLKPLRGLKGNVLGAKLLAVQDMATGQAIVVEAAADGEAGDNPLVPGALAQVRAMSDLRQRLWVADRGFCDYLALGRLSEAGDAFVVRHAKCKFEPDPAVPPRTGQDEEKRPFREEWGWLGNSSNPRGARIRVRRITVERVGDKPLVLITNLLDADCYSAQDLLLLYRRRWGIETMFQRVVQTFDLRHLIGATPEATVFQAAFCLLLYNITLIVCDYVAEGAQRPVAELSLQLMSEDIVDELSAWMKVIGPDETPTVLGTRRFAAPEEFRGYLRQRLAAIWTKRLTKQKTVKRPPKKPPRAYLRGGHSSVDRILRGVHEEIPIKPHKPTPSPRTAKDNRPNHDQKSS